MFPKLTARVLARRHAPAAQTYLKRGSRSVKSYATAAQSDVENVDVAIVGGGPVGLTLACALSSSRSVRETLRVVLIEGGDLSKIQNWSPEVEQYSNRVSSITNASRQFLEDIGSWEHIETSRTAPIEEMQVWDGLTDSRITFSASDIPGAMEHEAVEPEMARLTENFNLQRALLRRLEGNPQISLIDKIKVESIQREDREGAGWPIIHLANGRQLRARLLVGADGFNSPVRSYANIPSFGWSYDTQAIVATLSHTPRFSTEFQRPNTTAYQRFLPTGPIAFLPLSSTTSSLVWSTKPSLAAALLASDPGVLATMVNAAFRLPEISIRYLHNLLAEKYSAGSTLTQTDILDEVRWREKSHSIDSHSAYSSCEVEAAIGVPPADADMLPPLVTSIQRGTIASFPIRFNHVDAYVGEGNGERTVLVGDAAHTVHPLAGQGLNMGLADVQALAQCIEISVSRGSDIGSHTALLPYARDRYFENHKLLLATDKLHQIYSSTLAPVVWARSVGVEVINELSSIKGALMYSAGAQYSQGGRANASAWDLAASGVEALVGGANALKLLAGSIASTAESVIRNASQLTKKP